MAFLAIALCACFAGPVAGASAAGSKVHKVHRMSAKQKRVIRARLYRAVKKNPRVISQRSFVKRASLVNFKLPITVRLRGSDVATNPNSANLDLGASLGKRALALGGSLSGEIVFHDSFDGGALGNVEVTLNPGPKQLQTTSVPLLWNTDVTNPATSVAPVFNLGAGAAGCGNFHGGGPLTIGGNQTVPYWNTQSDYDNNLAPAGYVPWTAGVDDPARLVASPAVNGSDNNVGSNPNPFPYSASSVPGGFGQPPIPGDSILRTAPLSLGIAQAGTEVNQSNSSANGPQGSQNIVIGKSGGQANLFGKIPGKDSGIDITVNLATRINSILRSVDPDFVPLIANKAYTTTFAHCHQAYTGAVQNYITGVHLTGSLKISPAITADGALRIAKATLSSPASDQAHIALAACVYPYSLYMAENNSSDTVGQTVGTYISSGQLPLQEQVARKAPSSVNCGATPTKLVQDAPTLALNPANGLNGYTTSTDGSRVSVAGDLDVSNVVADILVGDRDQPAPPPALGNTYLALGDSIAYGYQAAVFAANAAPGGDCNSSQVPNPANLCHTHFDNGYVENFGAYLQGINPSLAITNLGCPGEKTTSLMSGFNPSGSGIGFCGKGSGFPYTFLHTNYGVGNSQLQKALAILAANPNTTSPVTIDIGANDLLDFLQITCGFGTVSYSPSCVQNGMGPTFTSIVNNLSSILTSMQNVAPNANYIVMGLYNPYPTALTIGTIGGDAAVANLNSQMRQVAISHHGRFVDPLPVFNPGGAAGGPESGDVSTICQLTNMCPGGTYNPASPGADIHPTNKGYKALASLFISASGL